MDFSKAFLHDLGDSEAEKLAALRSRVPDIVAEAVQQSEDVAATKPGCHTLWRVRIEEKGDAADIALLKFLRAEEFDVDKAAARVVKTLVFRADCKVDELAEADLPEHFQGHDSFPGNDSSGRPVMVCRFGGMDIDQVFGDLEAFVRYRTKVMETAIAKLKFERGAAEDLFQIHDYSGVLSSMYKSDVKNGVSAISKIFSEHYPEFKGKTVFLNFPAVFSKPFQALAALLPERTRRKFTILGQEDHATLFEMVHPGLVPEAMGGLYRLSAPAFVAEARSVIVGIRGQEEVSGAKVAGPVRVRWELRVCAREVAYEVLFVLAGGGEEVVARSAEREYLTAEKGVVSGVYEAPSAGELRFRFRNECAWFKRRVCAYRAEEAAA